MDNLRTAAQAALEMMDDWWPADVFDGSSGDEGPVRIAAVREALRAALAQTQGGWRPIEDGQRIAVVDGDDTSEIIVGKGCLEAGYKHKRKPAYSNSVKAHHPKGYAFCEWVATPAAIEPQAFTPPGEMEELKHVYGE